MNNRKTEQGLRNKAKALLEQSKVDCIIGYELGSLKFITTPLIARDKDSADRLVINPFIVGNLSVYLTELKGRVGIVAKGCDSRSIVSLIQDNQVKREDVVILGVPCSGTIDMTKVERLVGKDRDEIDDIAWEDSEVTITVASDRKEFHISEILFDDCLDCEFSIPQEYDILLGESSSLVIDKVASRKTIEALKAMPQEQRWNFWAKEFSRCIRCYACRNVCPACFCERCFVEESEPQWIAPVPWWQDNLIFQVTRNIHVAGRCTNCGECERVCPMNISLRNLTKEMCNIVDDLYHFNAGTDKEAAPLMTHYEATDPEDFIK
ncbi:4Fe-4S dicluster domain-containing protein [Chloroflexota bacterium]